MSMNNMGLLIPNEKRQTAYGLLGGLGVIGMRITVCETVCKNRPFKKENTHKLFIDDVKQGFKDHRKITPCHMDMVKSTRGVKIKVLNYMQVLAPEFKVCKGMVISRIKSEVKPMGMYRTLCAGVVFNTMFDEIVRIEI